MDEFTPHITAFRELPMAHPRASGHAGQGPRLDEDRADPRTWLHQLRRWQLSQRHPNALRLWRVVMRPGNSGRTKIERRLPSGRMIRIFEDDGLQSSFLTLVERRQDGPLFELPFADAAALWRDRHVLCHPACDRIVVRTTREGSHVA